MNASWVCQSRGRVVVRRGARQVIRRVGRHRVWRWRDAGRTVSDPPGFAAARPCRASPRHLRRDRATAILGTMAPALSVSCRPRRSVIGGPLRTVSGDRSVRGTGRFGAVGRSLIARWSSGASPVQRHFAARALVALIPYGGCDATKPSSPAEPRAAQHHTSGVSIGYAPTLAGFCRSDAAVPLLFGGVRAAGGPGLGARQRCPRHPRSTHSYACPSTRAWVAFASRRRWPAPPRWAAKGVNPQPTVAWHSLRLRNMLPSHALAHSCLWLGAATLAAATLIAMVFPASAG